MPQGSLPGAPKAPSVAMVTHVGNLFPRAIERVGGLDHHPRGKDDCRPSFLNPFVTDVKL